MTRRASLAWLAVLAVVALGAAALVVALRPATEVTPDEQARQIAAELRCPSCEGLSVADSPSEAAAEIRRQIAEQVAAGRNAEEIKQHFVARYGEWILLSPSATLVWLIPPAAVLAGVLGLAAWFFATRRRRGVVPAAVPVAPAAEAFRRRLREEVEALDG